MNLFLIGIVAEKIERELNLLYIIIKIAEQKWRKNAIVEYIDYQIPVTQLKGPKGNGDMQAVKRD